MNQKEKQVGAKYIIEASFEIEGVVEKHDVIGAIFGQTEGLFPKDFELRELQKSGKIGRIDIELKSESDKTYGTITVPSSLDRAETAIIAAAMETVDRVGPCEAKVTINRILDIRVDKREKIIQRAKELMRSWVVKETQEIEKVLQEVSMEDQRVQPIQYGKEKLTAAPDISKADELILVEGRADIINLLKNGYTGILALEGVKVPKTVIDLTKKKVTTAFLDGDRGGDLILKELLQVARPTYVARAPKGKEVEELNAEEIAQALANKVPVAEILHSEKYSSLASNLKGTLEAVMLKPDGTEMNRVPVSELVERLKESEGVDTIVFDGIITGRLLDTAREKGVKLLIGDRMAEGVKAPPDIKVKLFSEVS